MTAFKFSTEMNQSFVVPKGILEYLAGMDQSEEWNVRGVAGKNSREVDKLQERRKQKLRKIIKQDNFRDKVISFANDILPLFSAFKLNDREKINDLIGDWDFYFVIGPPRSGGTYVYTQVSEAVNWPWNQLLRTVTHDHLPNGNLIRGDDNRYGKIGWRIPDRYHNFVFQMCTFIEYAKREAPNSDSVVLKNMALAHGLPLIDRMFSDRAHCLLTVRHPASISASRAETWENQENTESFKRGCFKLWFNLYSEILRDGTPECELNIIKFGQPMDKFLDDFYEEHKKRDRESELSPTERNYDASFWEQDEFQERIRWIEDFYAMHGIDFPTPDKIL